MNILMITFNDPAGMGIAFTNAINRYTPHRCRLVSTAEKYGFEYETDIHLPDIHDDDYGELEQLMIDADVFHFHMLSDENAHLGPLVIRDHVRGKRILHHHHGHPDYILNAPAFNEKYRRLGRRVIVATPDLLKVAEDAVWVPNLVPLNDTALLPRFDSSLPRDKIWVCQAPTRKYHKNTREFVEVVSRVQQRNPRVSLLMIERMPYRQCLQLKRNSHVVFDHMRGWFGISSLESLSQGKPVIAGLDEWNMEQIRRFTGKQDLPWVRAGNPQELEKRLDELVSDSGKREVIGRQGRTFMEEVWNEQRVLEVLTGIYESL